MNVWLQVQFENTNTLSPLGFGLKSVEQSDKYLETFKVIVWNDLNLVGTHITVMFLECDSILPLISLPLLLTLLSSLFLLSGSILHSHAPSPPPPQPDPLFSPRFDRFRCFQSSRSRFLHPLLTTLCSLCLFVCLCSLCLFVCLCLSLFLSLSISLCLSVCLCLCLSLCVSVSASLSHSLSLSLSLSLYLSIYLSPCQSVFRLLPLPFFQFHFIKISMGFFFIYFFNTS